MIPYASTRQRIARLPLLGRAHDCLDETGLFSLSYGQKVYAVHARAGGDGVATFDDQHGASGRAPSGMPRVSSVHGSAGRMLALLLEESRQNSQVRWAELDNAAWTKTECTITANATRASDGSLTADKIVESNANAAHLVSGATWTPTANTPQSVAIEFAPAERGWAFIQTRDLAGTFATTFVNLATGALGTIAAAHSVRVVPKANGFWRVQVTWNSASGGSTCNWFYGPTTGDGVTSYAGNGASGIYATRAQREVDAAESSSGIPAGASAATRAADSIYFACLLAAGACQLFVDGIELKRASATQLSSTGLAYLGDAANADPRAAIYRPIGQSGYRCIHDPAAQAITDPIGTAATVGDRVRLLASLSAAGVPSLSVSINGGATESHTAASGQPFGPAWSAARFWLNALGTAAGTTGMFGYRAWAIAPLGVSMNEIADLCEVSG